MLCVLFAVYSGAVYLSGDEHGVQLPGPGAIAGKQLWQEKNCQSCHQLYGLGGYMGPDLTNIIAQKGVPYAAAIIKHGTGRMPDFGLTDAETAHLTEFLSWAGTSGSSLVPGNAVHWTGTYQIPAQ